MLGSDLEERKKKTKKTRELSEVYPPKCKVDRSVCHPSSFSLFAPLAVRGANCVLQDNK